MFSISALFFIFAALGGWYGIKAGRDRDWSRSSLAAVAAVCLALAGAYVFTIGSNHPGAGFWNDRGLGPEWECRNLGRAAAEVCFKDRPSWAK